MILENLQTVNKISRYISFCKLRFGSLNQAIPPEDTQMRTLHQCSCGQHFDLKVELVIHCMHNDHVVVQAPAAKQEVAEATFFERLSLLARTKTARYAAAGFLMMGVLGFDVLAGEAVKHFTAWQSTTTSNVVMP